MKESIPQYVQSERLKIDDDFYFKFSDEDQEAMHSRVWPYKNPEWILNKWKAQLEATDDTGLTEEELENKQHALWLWYHHASQFAYKDGDVETAIAFMRRPRRIPRLQSGLNEPAGGTLMRWKLTSRGMVYIGFSTTSSGSASTAGGSSVPASPNTWNVRSEACCEVCRASPSSRSALILITFIS